MEGFLFSNAYGKWHGSLRYGPGFSLKQAGWWRTVAGWEWRHAGADACDCTDGANCKEMKRRSLFWPSWLTWDFIVFFYCNVSGIDKNLSISPPAVELLFFIRKLKIEHKSRSVFLLLMQHTFVLVSYWHWQHHLWFYSLLQWKENHQFSFASQPRGDSTAASVSHYTWTGCGKMIQSIF